MKEKTIMANVVNTPTRERNETGRTELTRGATFTPRVDIVETQDELTLFADLPGVGSGDVELRYENGELFLQGRAKRRVSGKNLLAQEYEEGDFYRAFTIHESIDSTRISAECKNGVLTVHLPKTEAVRPRQIPVKG
jgi:HSP20 family protein